MAQKIIYPHENKIAIITFNPRSEKTAQEIGERSVPVGLPFLIVEESDLPLDLRWSDAWEADFSSPDGYGEEKID